MEQQRKANRVPFFIAAGALLLAAVLAVLIFCPGLPTHEYLDYRITLNRLTRMGLTPATEGAAFGAPITRLQLARLVNSCYGIADNGDPLAAAMEQGYLQAVDGQADPDGPFTRGQAALALWSLLHMDGQGARIAGEPARDQMVEAAVSGGYLKMKGRDFRPDDPLTWGDAVKLLGKALGTVLCQPGTYTLRPGHDSNVTILCPDVALGATSVAGDVIVTAGAADGTVTLDGVSIGGRLVLQGGAGGVLLHDVTCASAVLDAPFKLRVVASGATDIPLLTVLSDARLEESGLTGQGFSAVTLSAALELDGSLRSLETRGAASASLSAASAIEELTAGGDLLVDGDGAVETLTVNQGTTTSQIVARSITLSADGRAVFGDLHLPAGPVSVTGADVVAVLNDMNTLSPGYALGDDADHVRSDLSLPTKGEHGSTITWQSSNEEIISTQGTVTRADYPLGDRMVTLKATIESGAIHYVRSFSLTVLQKEITPEQSVEADAAAIELQYGAGDSAQYVTHDVVLPTSGENGTTITWQSSHPNIISETGKVNRPTGRNTPGGDRTVTLTATVTKGSASATRTFTLVVKKRIVYTDTDYLAEDKEALYIVYAPGDSANHVTQSLLLPGTGKNGSKVTWKSSNTALIDNRGTVTLPAPGAGNQQVTLTATLAIGDHRTTKTFTVTVIAPPPPPTPSPTPAATPAVTPAATPAPTPAGT